MTNLDWLKQAEESENPEVQELLIVYKTSDNINEKNESERGIKQILFSEMEKKIVNSMPKTETKTKDKAQKAPEIIKNDREEFTLTLEDVEKTPIEELGLIIQKCKDELVFMEKNMPKNITPEIRKSYVKRRTFINNLKETAMRKRIDFKKEEKRKQNRHKVSSLRIKQLRLISLLEIGTSFTNIIRSDNGLKPDELVACMEENNEVLDKFPHLTKRWIVWKQKKLKKTENGYRLVG